MKTKRKDVEFNMVKVSGIVSFLKAIGETEITTKEIYKKPENVY